MRLECKRRHARKRWAENLGILKNTSVGDEMPNWELATDRGLWALSDLRLSNPAKMRKKFCWINITVYPRLWLIFFTQPTSTFSRIKCDKYIFIKKCVRSFIEVRHYCWLCFTTWTLTKRLEKKLDGNYTGMLRAILNKSWRQHPTKHQLYGHLPSITKTIQARRTRRAGHRWRSRDELISDVLLWTPTYGQAKAGRPPRRYIQQLCEDTGCSPEDLPEAMNDREKWRERARDIRASGTT